MKFNIDWKAIGIVSTIIIALIITHSAFCVCGLIFLFFDD